MKMIARDNGGTKGITISETYFVSRCGYGTQRVDDAIDVCLRRSDFRTAFIQPKHKHVILRIGSFDDDHVVPRWIALLKAPKPVRFK